MRVIDTLTTAVIVGLITAVVVLILEALMSSAAGDLRTQAGVAQTQMMFVLPALAGILGSAGVIVLQWNNLHLRKRHRRSSTSR